MPYQTTFEEIGFSRLGGGKKKYKVCLNGLCIFTKTTKRSLVTPLKT